MKTIYFLMCLTLISILQIPAAMAKEPIEIRAEAKQYYQEERYKKAYSSYFRLAKIGDYYSQNMLAKMYEKGQGKDVDLVEAYAWSVLAAESRIEGMTEKSDRLLEMVPDKAKAEKRAARLLQKYGTDTLQAKAERRETRKLNHKSGGCTGSILGCSKS